jgi:hypothetical protein
MDLKMFAGAVQSGRRGALVGLLAGTFALLGNSSNSEARRRCKRCPQRGCCACSGCNGCNPGETLEPKCVFISSTDPDTISQKCGEACAGYINVAPRTPQAGEAWVCSATGTDASNFCVRARCPI